MNLDPYTRKLRALQGALERAERAVHRPDMDAKELEARENYALFRAHRLAVHLGMRDVSGLHVISAGLRVVRGPFAGVVVKVEGPTAHVQLDGTPETKPMLCRSLTVLD